MLLGFVVVTVGIELAFRLIDPSGVSYFVHLRQYSRELLRASDAPGLVFEHVPEHRIDVGVRLETNRLGLRGQDFPERKPPGERRLLVLGDSVAFGWGVSESEIFCRLLEKRWSGTETPWRVINSGVVAYNTVQEHAYLVERGFALDPDAVLLVYCGNDADIASDLILKENRNRPERPAELEGRVSHLEWWLLTNRWGLYLTHLMRYQTMSRLQDRLMKLQAEGDREELRAWREIIRLASPRRDLSASLAALEGCRRACRERNLPFGIVRFSGPSELAAFCEEKEVPWVDTGFDELSKQARYRLSAVDSHPNEAGHRLLADLIAEGLESFGWISGR